MPKSHSESFAWREVARLARKARSGDHPIASSEAIIRIADGMLHQLAQGIHANPPLLVFANPGKRPPFTLPQDIVETMSKHVLAVLYIHTEDGEPYAHGFGNAELDLHTKRDGTVTITGLAESADVEMLALEDGTVLLRGTHGQSLWDEF